MLSAQSYFKGLSQALKNGKYKGQSQIKDIFVVPDYVSYLEGCGDSKFGKYAKGEGTQHQFIFEAVERSPAFPLGCQTFYRAYSSDEVYEIMKGQSPYYEDVNYVARLCKVTTYPLGDERTATAPGMYLLQSLPPPDRQLCPFELLTGSREVFEKVKHDIKRHFASTNPTAVREWEDWDINYVPQSDDATEYLQK